MSRWFRFYSDAMRHPKVAKLSDAQFRLWCELLSVAAENDGVIPPLSDLRYVLKRRLDHLSRLVDDLVTASLIDPLEDGYMPHGWDKRQYKSDTSTDRVQKHRAKRNVSETPPDTETDTETDTDKEESTLGSLSPSEPAPPIAELTDAWNEICGDVLPKVQRLSGPRRAKLGKRFRDDFRSDLASWRDFCERIRSSKFLTGDNDSAWRAGFDWCLEPRNLTKILEGNYANKSPPVRAAPQRSAVMIELEKLRGIA